MNSVESHIKAESNSEQIRRKQIERATEVFIQTGDFNQLKKTWEGIKTEGTLEGANVPTDSNNIIPFPGV